MFSVDPVLTVQAGDFCPGQEQRELQARLVAAGIPAEAGAIAAFTGFVRSERDSQGGDLLALEIEHYPAMTQVALQHICARAAGQWRLITCRIIHRVGRMRPGEHIVLVLVASAHRADAFAACEFIMDFLKTSAPFWKKACFERGERWVEACARDEARLRRWKDVD